MELQLYRTYTPREAVSLLAEAGEAGWVWDEQLALLPGREFFHTGVGPEAIEWFEDE
jgi:hypothetical protein